MKIIDCTLREGIQAPNVYFSDTDSLEIARQLEAAGVDMIEVGHPYASVTEFRRAASVKRAVSTPVLVHARAKKEDIHNALRVGADWVGIFAAINAVSFGSRFANQSMTDLFHLIEDAVRYAKQHDLNVRFSLEDASRTDFDQLVDVFSVALDSGADRICIADSTGIHTPSQTASLIGKIVARFPKVDIEVHSHNDRGLALANSLAALEAGASWISSSVNGLGERCGITDTCALMLNMNIAFDRPMKSALLPELSELVAALSGKPLAASAPVVGRDSFTHTAALHVRAMERNPDAYQSIDPALFGRSHEYSGEPVKKNIDKCVVRPKVIPASELPYHRDGPGRRFVMIDHRVLPGSNTYCIVRRVDGIEEGCEKHVDPHRHNVDSLFLFIGDDADLRGLKVEVTLANRRFIVDSPCSVFIPSGIFHSYSFLSGSGYFINQVQSGLYQDSLLKVDG